MSYSKVHDEHAARDGHYTMSTVNLSSYLGTIQIDMCEEGNCPHVEIRCTHEFNTWHENETVLLCDLCGADGT